MMPFTHTLSKKTGVFLIFGMCILAALFGIVYRRYNARAASSGGIITATDCTGLAAQSCAVVWTASVTLDGGWSAKIWTAEKDGTDDASGNYTLNVTLPVGSCTDGILVAHSADWVSQTSYGPAQGCAKEDKPLALSVNAPAGGFIVGQSPTYPTYTISEAPPNIAVCWVNTLGGNEVYNGCNGGNTSGSGSATVNGGTWSSSHIGSWNIMARVGSESDSVSFDVVAGSSCSANQGKPCNTDTNCSGTIACDGTTCAGGTNCMSQGKVCSSGACVNTSSAAQALLTVNGASSVSVAMPNTQAALTFTFAVANSTPANLKAYWNWDPTKLVGAAPFTIKYLLDDCSNVGSGKWSLILKDASGNAIGATNEVTVSITDPTNLCAGWVPPVSGLIDVASLAAGNIVANKVSTCPTGTNAGYSWVPFVEVCAVSNVCQHDWDCPATDSYNTGCYANSNGGCTCGRRTGSSSFSIGPCCQTANSNGFATQNTADALAKCLGGTVYGVGMSNSSYSWSQPDYGIKFSTGAILNAGYVARRYVGYSRSLADEMTYCEAKGGCTCEETNSCPTNGGGKTGDTTLPQVSFTSPLDGSAVKGFINVIADATDNVGVIGVQFKLDGKNVGPEDAVSQYFYAWDTTKVSDGTHTLTAEARDAANNKRIASIAVSVGNVQTLPPVPPIGGGSAPGNSCSQNFTLASGFTAPCPVFGISSPPAGSKTATVSIAPIARAAAFYAYTKVYISKTATESCPAGTTPAQGSTAWCQKAIQFPSTAYLAGSTDYLTQNSGGTGTLDLTGFTGQRWVVLWDWNWNTSQSCWYGPGGSSCIVTDTQGNITNVGGASWRLQLVDVP